MTSMAEEDDDLPPGGADGGDQGSTGATGTNAGDQGSGATGDDGGKAAEDRKLTRENQSLRRRLRELEAAEEARKLADLTETERANARVAELEAQATAREERARKVALRADIVAASGKHGIVDPDAAVRLIDTSSLEYDEDADTWIGVDDALGALVQQRPWIAQSAAPPNGGGSGPSNPARNKRTGAALTREDLAAMSQSEINALSQEDIDAALAAGR